MKKVTFFLMFAFTIVCANATTKGEVGKKIMEQVGTGQKSVTDGVTTVYSDGKEVVQTVYKDAKAIAPKLEQAVTSIAKGLKSTADGIWDILVAQQLVWSICFLVLTLSACTNWYIFYRRIFPTKKSLYIPEYAVLERDTFTEVENPRFDADYKRKADSGEYSSSYKKTDERYKETIMVPSGGREQYFALKPNPIMEKQNKIHWFTPIHLILCFVLSYFSFLHFGDMLTGFINPKFGAIMQIADVAMKLR